jgi:Ser/Thr protein kinase RdoA (MazF antagonist)
MPDTLPVIPAQALSCAIRGQIFPAHPYFPQLKIASDPALMLEIFRKHLKPVKENSRIETCAPVRFRFRDSGSRCILQYVLGVAGRNGTRSDLWVTIFIHAVRGDMEKAWADEKSADALPVAFLLFEPLSPIPELQMLVQIFPHDRLIRHLPLAMSGPWPVLQEKLLASFGSGPWQFAQPVTEALRYLAGESAVLRYTLTGRRSGTSEAQTKRFYLKLYRTRDGEEVFRFLQAARQKAERKEFTIIEPVIYCPERRCLVLNEASGHSFQQILLGGVDAKTSARQVARALAAFHQSNIPATRRRSAEEQIVFLNRAADLLCWACPASTELIHAIVQKVGARLRDQVSVPIHWDLKSDHIFLEQEKVLFLDLDAVCLGDPARDVAHLAAHIACGIDSPETVSELAQATADTLVEEYFGLVPAEWREQFNLQYAIAVVEGACGLFKRQELRWSERAAEALHEAQRALSE